MGSKYTWWRRAMTPAMAALIGIVLCAGEAASFEHPRYEIEATVDTQAKTIRATQTVTFTNNTTTPVDELFFHTYANRRYTEQEKQFIIRYAGYFKVDLFPSGFERGTLAVTRVTQGGTPLSFFVEGDDEALLRVALAGVCLPGESVTVAMDFTVTVPHAYGRCGWHREIMALSRWYPILSVLAPDGWQNRPFYPYHRPFFSDAAYYAVRLTVPESEVVIHSGRLAAQSRAASGAKVLSIETPLPIRDFSLALSTRYQLYEDVHEGITVKSYYLPGDERHARAALTYAGGLMAFYTQLFGEYPYSEVSIAPVYLGYGGEQMSNMVFIDTRAYQLPRILKRYFDFLISHEMGHQWFYNLVGADGYTEMWLEEGINSYFILRYLENKYGYNAGVIEWPAALDWMLPNISFRRARDTRYKSISRTTMDRPIVGELAGFTEPSAIFSLTYGKGSAVVSMLRSHIGDEAFFRVFRRVFKDYRFKNISLQDFIALCEQESGQDMQWFFGQWLMTDKKCDYAVMHVKQNTVTLQNRGTIVMPVEVAVTFTDGTTEVFAWSGQGTEAIGFKKPIRRVIIDPEEKLPDIDRTNNSWPRTVTVTAVPVYLGVYDIPVFLKDDHYNVVIGPTVSGSAGGLRASFQKPYDYTLYGASEYEFSEQLVKSRAGFQLNNLFTSQTAAGIEVFNTRDLDGGEEDLTGGKVYVRRELWPISSSLAEINDHATLYLIRNRGLSGDEILSGREYVPNVSYLKRNEAIVGGVLRFSRAGPYPDPRYGFTVNTLLESSGHFLGATQYFYRGMVDTAFYHATSLRTTLAVRLKYGWGHPGDKNLYQLGGYAGLRGYDRKTIRGANAALGSVEFRFPIFDNLRLNAVDNLIGLEAVRGVIFTDAGQSWFDDIRDTKLRTNAGVGLRFIVTIGSFLERIMVRFDAAQAIDEPSENTKFWFGVGHAF